MSDPASVWVAPVAGDEADVLAACQRIEREAFDHEQLDLASELRQAHVSLWVAGLEGGSYDTPCAGADKGREPLAFVLVWYLADEVEVQTVATAPRGRRRGLGRALVEQALGAARERGCVRALLEVRAGNEAARGLYRSLGFQEDGVRRRYYSDPVEDAVLMSRPLQETP